MSTVALRRFSNPDTLKHIGNRYLIELLSPYREFFANRGLDLPASPTADPVDCERLANIFMMPDTDMPVELADALYYIHEMSLKDTMDKLVETAAQRHIDLDLPDEAEPADVAVRFWLKDNRLLQEIHAEQHLTRPKSFLYFNTFVNPVPTFTIPTRETLAAMEATMDAWFESKKRGRGCKVFVYPRENECWFMVRHGETCRREGSLDQGQPGSVFYRPQKHDILVYDIAEGEIRIHAGSKKERELYLSCFGLHIFGSERFFPPGGIFTLQAFQKRPEQRSLRQCRNLVQFVNSYAQTFGLNWQLEPSEDLLGGKVIVLPEMLDYKVFKSEYDRCIASGNRAYEMMFLVPPYLVERTEDDHCFKYAKEFNSSGFPVWDGTSKDLRSSYPTDLDQHRVLQYDSCRGLEAWVTVCVGLDEFVRYKTATFDEEEQREAAREDEPQLFQESTEEMRQRFVYLWSLIPLTRAIDTLVITLKNPQSEYSQKLKQCCLVNRDFVEWRE